MSYPKERRLLSRQSYLAMAGPNQFRLKAGPFLVVAKANGLGRHRLGVTATKKVGKATARNRFKRVAREFFRLNQSGWPGGFDLLFIALQGQDPFRSAPLDPAKFKAFLEAAAAKAKPVPGGPNDHPR